MRKNFPAIFGMIILVGGFAAAPLVALGAGALINTDSSGVIQSNPTTSVAPATGIPGNVGTYTYTGQNAQGNNTAVITSSASPNPQVLTTNAQTGAATTAPVPQTCSFTSPFSQVCLTNAAVWFATIIIIVFGWLLWVAGVFLNAVVSFTVINISGIFSTGNSAGAINGTWALIRNFIDMGFIFVLLWIGIKTILGLDRFDKEVIIKVIIAAVLINFSLFFTKVVIDASNIISLPFYNAMVTSTCSTSNLANCDGSTADSGGISNAFMETLRLTTIFQTVGQNSVSGSSQTAVNTQLTNSGLGIGQLLIVGIMSAILLTITSFVFFAAGFLFVTRLVILIFVAILSPIAFIGMILPKLKKYSDMWLDVLIGQAFFAPVYFILTFIGLAVLSNLTSTLVPNSNTAGSGFGLLAKGDVSSIGIFITFVISIAFIVAALMIAKKMASQGGGIVQAVVGAGQKWGGQAIFGGASRGAQLAAGLTAGGAAGANALANKTLSNKARQGGVGGGLARLTLAGTGAAQRTANWTAERTGDIRNTKVFRNLDTSINQGQFGRGAKTNWAPDVAGALGANNLYTRRQQQVNQYLQARAARQGGQQSNTSGWMGGTPQSQPAPQATTQPQRTQQATVPIVPTVHRPQNVRGTAPIVPTPAAPRPVRSNEPTRANENMRNNRPITGAPLARAIDTRPKAPVAPREAERNVSEMSKRSETPPRSDYGVTTSAAEANERAAKNLKEASARMQTSATNPANDSHPTPPTPPAAPAAAKPPVPEAPDDNIRAIEIDKAA